MSREFLFRLDADRLTIMWAHDCRDLALAYADMHGFEPQVICRREAVIYRCGHGFIQRVQYKSRTRQKYIDARRTAYRAKRLRERIAS